MQDGKRWTGCMPHDYLGAMAEWLRPQVPDNKRRKRIAGKNRNQRVIKGLAIDRAVADAQIVGLTGLLAMTRRRVRFLFRTGYHPMRERSGKRKRHLGQHQQRQAQPCGPTLKSVLTKSHAA